MGNEEKRKQLLKQLNKITVIDCDGEIPEYFERTQIDKKLVEKLVSIIEKLLLMEEINALPNTLELMIALRKSEYQTYYLRLLDLIGSLKKKAKNFAKEIGKELNETITRVDDRKFFLDVELELTIIDVLEKIDGIKEAQNSIISLLYWIKTNNYSTDRMEYLNYLSNEKTPEAKLGIKIIDLIVEYQIREAIPDLIKTIEGSIFAVEKRAVKALGELNGEEVIIPLLRIAWGLMAQSYEWWESAEFVDGFTTAVHGRLQKEAEKTLNEFQIKIDKLVITRMLNETMLDMNFYAESDFDTIPENLGKRIKEGKIPKDIFIEEAKATIDQLEYLEAVEKLYEFCFESLNEKEILPLLEKAGRILGYDEKTIDNEIECYKEKIAKKATEENVR